jgi:hypothetical protein
VKIERFYWVMAGALRKRLRESLGKMEVSSDATPPAVQILREKRKGGGVYVASL